MSDQRDYGYWLYQIYLLLGGTPTDGTAPGASPITVQGQGPTVSGKRLDVALGWDRIGAHSSGLAINTATTLSAPANAKRVLIQAITQNVRYTLDGTAPTATLGFQLKASDPPLLIPIGPNTTLKVIEETATASLQYQWLD